MKSLILKFIGAGMVLVTGSSLAASALEQKSENEKPYLLQLTVSTPHRGVTFLVRESAPSALLMLTDQKASRKAPLSAKDLKHLRRKLSQLPKTGHDLTLCHEQFIEIKTHSRNLIACVDSPQKLTTQLTALANLLQGYVSQF